MKPPGAHVHPDHGRPGVLVLLVVVGLVLAVGLGAAVRDTHAAGWPDPPRPQIHVHLRGPVDQADVAAIFARPAAELHLARKEDRC